jgi:hypothetical protein
MFWNETTFVYNNSTKESSDDNLEHNVTLKLGLAVPMGICMYMLSLVTVVGNAMVLHAIRTERRLQTVSTNTIISLMLFKVNSLVLTISFPVKQDRTHTYNVTLKRVCVTIIAVQNQ